MGALHTTRVKNATRMIKFANIRSVRAFIEMHTEHRHTHTHTLFGAHHGILCTRLCAHIRTPARETHFLLVTIFVLLHRLLGCVQVAAQHADDGKRGGLWLQNV